MENSSVLFELVKSLSKSEKRYFKLSCSVHKGMKNYLKLFDAIDTQAVYDERAIQQKHGFKKLPNLKNYLYSLILKSLQGYHSTISIDSTLKNLLLQIEILYNKALYDACEKMLSRAKKLAYKHEQFLAVLEMLEWERKIIYAKAQELDKNKNLETIENETKEILKKYDNYLQYRKLNSGILKEHRKERHIRNNDSAKYDHIIQSELFKKNKSLSSRANYLYHFTKGLYNLSKGDYVNAYQNFSEVLLLFQSTPGFVQPNFSGYVSTLHNMIIAAHSLKKYDESIVYIQKLKSLENDFHAEVKDENIQLKIFASCYINELGLCINKGEFVKGLSIVPEIEKGLIKFKHKIVPTHAMTLYYNISTIYFGVNDYSQSLLWLNKILNDPEIVNVPDVHCYAQIFNLVIHYELGNEDLLEYIVKSTHRFLYKKNRLYKVETSLLNFIRKEVPEMITKEQQIQAFRRLKIELEEITQDIFEKKALEYFDILAWLDSKTGNKSFARILKEKTQ